MRRCARSKISRCGEHAGHRPNVEGDFENGIADCNEAIRLLPNRLWPEATGVSLNKMGQYESALADFKSRSGSIRNKQSRIGIGACSQREARLPAALAVLPKPSASGGFASAYEAAVLLSTCLTQSYRNGRQAIEDATKLRTALVEDRRRSLRSRRRLCGSRRLQRRRLMVAEGGRIEAKRVQTDDDELKSKGPTTIASWT